MNTLTPRKSPAPRARTRLGKWRATFLKTLAKTPSVTMAAKAAGIPRRTAYDHRERDPEFAQAWDDALNQSLDVLEHQIYQRALKDDAQLAMFFLKAHRPSVYRETSRMEIDARACGVLILPEQEA